MIAADWAKPLFDIQQMRQVRYPLPAKDVDDDQAASIREVLCKNLPPLASGDSPFYQVVPGFPDKIDADHLSAFREAFEELSEFQAEVNGARFAPPSQRKQRVLELWQRYKGGIPIPKAVTIELLRLIRDCTDWQTTLEFITGLPADVQELAFVKEQRELARAYTGDPFLAIGALQELIRS